MTLMSLGDAGGLFLRFNVDGRLLPMNAFVHWLCRYVWTILRLIREVAYIDHLLSDLTALGCIAALLANLGKDYVSDALAVHLERLNLSVSMASRLLAPPRRIS